jgi:glucose-6-phosphate isomerase
MASTRADWARYRKYLCAVDSLGLTLDPSRMTVLGGSGGEAAFDAALAALDAPMKKAFEAMDALEAGAIANPDEKRMVGHYWLRDAARAPSAELRAAIETTNARLLAFAREVHEGKRVGSGGAKFTDLLIVGIGGSALGPQLVSRALGGASDRMAVWFFDNTDPDGMDLVLAKLAPRLATTLVVVISKSGGTKETRNGMLEARWAFERAGVPFAKHFVAVTGEGSALDETAKREGWIERFPMWDWVGGRTSELSAVGLLPAALQGIDVEAMLAGARDADAATRVHDLRKNPAALLAACWHYAGDGKGKRDMVILPYKDRLELFSRYLQQLIMESLGKELDLQGNVVHQGIAVYGNKGSTDQHAYVQQLREGVPNFFATFLEVLRDRAADSREVEPGATTGDYLFGFFLGTRSALAEKERPSVTLTVEEVSPRVIGALIALFERATGLYATLVGINAYHQPGVEAGKKAAAEVLALQAKIVAHVGAQAEGAEAIAAAIGTEDVETVHKLCVHLAANGKLRKTGGGPGASFAKG